MALAPEDIARVREATDLVALVSEHVALKRQGRRFAGLCPFHQEKTPSFSLNAEDGLYYCFGCQASGDAITFVQQTEGLDFREAVQRLAERAGIQLVDDSRRRSSDSTARLREALSLAVSFYEAQLAATGPGETARSYLHSRGITGELAATFHLGLAPDAWSALAEHLRLPPHLLAQTGLGYVNRAGRVQDSLRARLVFPIFDSGGRPIAFGGRVVPGIGGGGPAQAAAGHTGPGNTSAAPAPAATSAEPKYKNTPETALYQKRRALYGLHLAKDEIVGSGRAVVCEGYTDVLAFFAAGLPAAIATCGTALTEDHLKILGRFAQKVVLSFDADPAGLAAAGRIYEWEQAGGIDLYVASLPAGSDPASLGQEDPTALLQAIESAIPLLGFRIRQTVASHDLRNPEGRAKAATAALVALSQHPSNLVRDEYLMTVADLCHMDPRLLRQELAAIRGRPAAPGRPERTTGAYAVRSTGGQRSASAPHSTQNPRSPDRRVDRSSSQPPAPARQSATPPRRAARDIPEGPFTPGAADRAEMEALRLSVQRPADMAPYLDDVLFVNPFLKDALDLLASHGTLVAAIDAASGVRPDLAGLLTRLDMEETSSDPEGVARKLITAKATGLLSEIATQARRDPGTSGRMSGLSRYIKGILEEMADTGNDKGRLVEVIAAIREIDRELA